jgi:DNA-binding MarR family transcriptional regulator
LLQCSTLVSGGTVRVLDLESQIAPDGDVGEGFDEYLFYLLTQVANRRNRDFAPALEAIGLSIPEWRAMSVMNRLDGCLMSELAEFTTVDRTTLTRTVDQLVKRGLVGRHASAHDRRQVMVALSVQGQTCFERAVDALRNYNTHVLNGLSDTDVRTLRTLLQRILMNVVQDPNHFQKVLKFER